MLTKINTEMKFDKCLGTWVNPYNNSKGIISFSIYQREGKTYIKIQGKEGGIKPGDWGESELTGHSYSPNDNQATAYKATYDLGFADALLAINENKGLLVILALITLKNESDQSDYFIREFYCRK